MTASLTSADATRDTRSHGGRSRNRRATGKVCTAQVGRDRLWVPRSLHGGQRAERNRDTDTGPGTGRGPKGGGGSAARARKGRRDAGGACGPDPCTVLRRERRRHGTQEAGWRNGHRRDPFCVRLQGIRSETAPQRASGWRRTPRAPVESQREWLPWCWTEGTSEHRNHPGVDTRHGRGRVRLLRGPRHTRGPDAGRCRDRGATRWRSGLGGAGKRSQRAETRTRRGKGRASPTGTPGSRPTRAGRREERRGRTRGDFLVKR